MDVLRLQQLDDPRDAAVPGGQQEDSDFSICCECSGFSWGGC